jgi:hypothetical protein
MQDWIAKLDDSLRLSERDILTHAGRVSHEVAAGRSLKPWRYVLVPHDVIAENMTLEMLAGQFGVK